MEKQFPIRQTNRREMLKLSGMSVLGGVVASALTPGKARAEGQPIGVSYASWIHGHSMQVEYPERLVRLERDGWGTVIEGKPDPRPENYNWFHFAIPTPVIINDVRLQADSILLCFSAGSTDAFVRSVHVYDGGGTPIAVFDDIYLPPGNPAPRLILPGTPTMGFGLGISVGVGFGGDLSKDHSMTFSAAGCDFVIRNPA